MSELAKKRLGEILVERGFISDEQLREALRSGKRLGEALLEMGALSADELNWALSELLGVPYVEFRDEMVDFDLARTLPEEVLRRHNAFPVLRVGDELTVIMSDPTNRHAVVELEALTGAKVTVAIAARETIRHLLDKAFPPEVGGIGRLFGETDAAEAVQAGLTEVYDLFASAVREGATELHLDPRGADTRVTVRVAGRLAERAQLSRSVAAAVIARLRATAGLRGATLPRHASVRTRVGAQDVELGVLLFPTIHGEAVTLRIWRSLDEPPTLASLGLPGPGQEALAALTRGAGLVVVVGLDPRARGALLYALARAAADPARRVVTIERVASFIVPEFVQVQLPADAEDGAATVLSSPGDVTVVEDLGQVSTCLAALGATEQGALVLGGVPAPSGALALGRLLDLAVPPRALAAAVRAFVHVRRQESRHEVEVLAMSEELRQGLLSGRGTWTSQTS
jgi:type IV pilus assembly protein PilB